MGRHVQPRREKRDFTPAICVRVRVCCNIFSFSIAIATYFEMMRSNQALSILYSMRSNQQQTRPSQTAAQTRAAVRLSRGMHVHPDYMAR